MFGKSSTRMKVAFLLAAQCEGNLHRRFLVPTLPRRNAPPERSHGDRGNERSCRTVVYTRMSRLLLLITGCITLLLFESCDSSFNPSAPFRPEMVVYSVLSTASDTQYVRIYTTYEPSDANPADNPDEVSVADAQVTVSEVGGPTFSFQPITIQRPDTSRYTSAIGAYASFPFFPERGKTYALSISSHLYGSVASALTVPRVGFIAAQNVLLLRDPWNVPLDDIALSIGLSPVAKGFLVRFYLNYELLDSTGWRPMRLEVPVAIRRTVDGQLLEYVYPKVQRRTTPANGPEGQADHFIYLTDAYQESIEAILGSGWTIRFKQAVIYLIQFDEALYNYYFIANGFKDASSIRLDEPNYSNISGGVGIFGSLAVDSSVIALPEQFPPRRY